MCVVVVVGGGGDWEEEGVIELGLHAKLREKITNWDPEKKIFLGREGGD